MFIKIKGKSHWQIRQKKRAKAADIRFADLLYHSGSQKKSFLFN
jgi:hypothetical protein